MGDVSQEDLLPDEVAEVEPGLLGLLAALGGEVRVVVELDAGFFLRGAFVPAFTVAHEDKELFLHYWILTLT